MTAYGNNIGDGITAKKYIHGVSITNLNFKPTCILTLEPSCRHAYLPFRRHSDIMNYPRRRHALINARYFYEK